MRDRDAAHNALGPPTPVAAFDVPAFARESERSLEAAGHDAAAEAFPDDELPTQKRVSSASEPPPPSVNERFLSLDDGTIIDVDRIPVLAASRTEMSWLDLGDEAVRLVLRIDGETTVRALVEQMSCSRDEVAVILGTLTRDGLLHFR